MSSLSQSQRRVFRRAVTAIAATVTSALLVCAAPTHAKDAADAADAESSVPGPSGCATHGSLQVCFSSPASKHGHDVAVLNRIRRLFDAAGEGDTLRIAMFRWDIPSSVHDLLAAQRRGAVVEIVADHDVVTNPAGRRVLREIERRDRDRDNVVVCKGACLPWRGRGPAPPAQDILHLKLVLADIGGHPATVVTSLNLERRQASQYNSLVRIVNPRIYAFELAYFQRLRNQSLRAHGERWDDRDKISHGSPAATVYPRRADLVVKTLRQVRCVKDAHEIDVMVAVIQRYDIRAQLGRLDRSGCRVRIVVTRERIENWLQSQFRLRDGRTANLPDSRVRTISTHDKVIAIHARWKGRSRWMVLTGTSNLTCGGLLYNDETMLRLKGRWIYRQYLAHVVDAFSRAHQSQDPLVPNQAHCT